MGEVSAEYYRESFLNATSSFLQAAGSYNGKN